MKIESLCEDYIDSLGEDYIDSYFAYSRISRTYVSLDLESCVLKTCVKFFKANVSNFNIEKDNEEHFGFYISHNGRKKVYVDLFGPLGNPLFGIDNLGMDENEFREFASLFFDVIRESSSKIFNKLGMLELIDGSAVF
ncbi:MAG: hypothetical protein QXH60_00410 [Candidatus Pacearchaeota archaeon]